MAVNLRSPHLLPGGSPRRSARLLYETPLEAWREEIGSGRGGIFSADKLAALAVVLMIIFSQIGFVTAPARAATLVVNSTANGSDASPGNGVCQTSTAGQCTLRAAIQEANALGGIDIINFNIPTSDSGYSASPVAFRIQPSGSVLPNITGQVVIDATTQPEFATAGRPVIVLDGSLAPMTGDPNGLSLNAGNSTIRGLVIQNFGEDGIEIDVAGNNLIVGNYIGTDVTGTLARPNGAMDVFPVGGISVKTDGNTIGGTSAADRNIISGNTQLGVGFRNSASNNVVIGNYIGTNVAGTAMLPNNDQGIWMESGSGSNIIGGSGAGEGNLISGNNTANTATSAGIYVLSSDNVIQGNLIGTDVSGTANLQNNGAGIALDSSAANNLIGGTAAGAGNTIGYNKGDGVRIFTGAGSGNAILGNSIFSSEDPGLGIDLQNNVVTSNDSGDGDSGPNDLLNFPVITSASESGGTVTVTFDLDVPANPDQYRVEFFTNPSGIDVSGYGEAETFASAVTTAPGTYLTHNFSGSGGDLITATATRIDSGAATGFSSTSEISAAVTVNGAGTVVVNSTGNASDNNPSDDVCNTGGTVGSDPECTLRAAIQEANASATVDTIHFNIPTSDSGYTASPVAFTIQPGSTLPAITTSMTIDGTTQPEYATSGRPVVELSGSSAGSNADGFSLTGGTSTIRGLVVNNWEDEGFALTSGGNSVFGNYIGTDVTGSAAAPNRIGVVLRGAGNRIGGLGADGNLISGNTNKGVMVTIGGSSTEIVGNLVGTDASGSSPLPNGGGIDLNSADDSFVGGTDPSFANTVAYNTSYGVAVTGSSEGNSILGNAIHSNGGLGIDHNNDGVTGNDVGDGDTGQNDFMNFPEITSATASAGNVTVTFDLDVPVGTYRVEFLDNTAADGSGYGEGEAFLGSVDVSAGTGLTHVVSGVAGDIITATATESLGGGNYGSTSEFSAASAVVSDGSIGRWRFDEGSGTTAIDSSGAGHDGVITGADHISGFSSTALDFSGSSGERVVVGDPADGSLDIGTGDFSVAAWFRTTNLPGSSDFHQLVFKSDGSEGYELFLTDGGSEPRLSFRARDDGSSWTALVTTDVDDGAWHHVSGVIDGGTISLYLDGTLVDTQVYGGTNIDTTDLLAFGADMDGLAWSDYEGDIDEVNIYGRALSAGEVAALALTAPVAVDDSTSTSVDTAVVVDVLANDSDPNGDTLTVDSVTQGTNGSVANNGTDVTYTPDASWTGIDTFTYIVSDGNGGTDTATVTVNVGVLAPVVLDNIQKGTTVLGNGSASTTATITAVDPIKAFLIFSVRGNDATPSDMTINGVLTDPSTLTFSRVGTSNTVTIEWSVAEFVSGVTVQRGAEYITSGGPIDVGISAVDLSYSFVLSNVSGEGNAFGQDDFARATLTSPTNLRIDVGNGLGSTVAWQVIQYNEAVVQRGTTSFASGDSSKTATVSSVDTSKSWLVYGYTTVDGSGTNIGQKLVRGLVTDGTTLAFDRSSTGQTLDVAWELVEFTDATEVQHASVAFSSSETLQDVAITAVDPARSIAVGGTTLYGGRSAYVGNDNPGVGWFATNLTSGTNVRVQRDAALATADLGWFVIEWAAPTAPEPVVLDDIQKGVTTIPDGSSGVTVTIAPVDMTKSFLTFTLRGNNVSPDNIPVTGELTSPTTVAFTRFGTAGDLVVDWSVLEFVSGVSVQRGSTTLGGATTTNVPIAPVDLARSFALINQRGAGSSFGDNDFVRATLSSSNLALHIGSAASNIVKWQIITYNDATVQQGTISLGSGTSTGSTGISSVDPAKSWLIYNTTTDPGTPNNIGQKLLRGRLVDSNTLTFDRSSTGQLITFSYFVVEFSDATTVQRGSASFGTSTTSVNTTVTAVDPSLSIAVGGTMLYGGRSDYTSDDNPGVGWMTTHLTSPTGLRTQRGVAAGSTADLEWSVITWAGAPQTTVSVNSTDDNVDLFPGDGYCDTGQLNSAGAVECTLRAAIQEANASTAVNTIHFAMPATESGHSGGVWTIAPGSELPTITDPVAIDGMTQTGYATTPIVELNGSGAGGTSDGLRIFSASVEVRGFAINRFGADGIEVDTTSTGGVVIAGNHIGLDASGLIDRGNGGRGIDLQTGSGPTTVGGTTAADRNVISGNGGDGIIVFGTNGNTIIGNYIGTDVTANASGAGIGNGADGIAMGSTAANNIIGEPGSGNVLSGNSDDGFENDATGSGNTVQANIIGLGVDGTTLVPNGRYGVVIYNGANNTLIGGGGAGEGNVISGNVESGVVIDGNGNPATAGNTLEGNLIGTDATGTLDRGNGTHGVHVFDGAADNVIGGTSAGAGNTISGNDSDGIFVTGASTGTLIQGNHIGVNAAGNAAVGNGGNGIEIDFDVPNQSIGGSVPGAGNVISGNLNGIYSLWADDMVIEGNIVGLDVTGTVDLGNTNAGIRVGGDNVVVGGTIAGARNVVSGNGFQGVYLDSATSALVQGNYIGTDATGLLDRGNGSNGVYSTGTDNQIGGTVAGAGNIISRNGFTGVSVITGATDAAILGNSIVANNGIGIDLGNDGVTGNDSGDGDAGANDLLNYPVITSATESGGVVTLVGTWDMPAGWYRIETFTNTIADPSGYGEGESITGSSVLYHDGTGSGPWGAAFSGSVGDVIAATATECTDSGCTDFNSTSEFSAAVTVTVADTTAPVITLVGANPQTMEVGGSYTELGATALDDIDGDITGSIVIDATAVNTAVLGSYLVTYDASDAAGNPAIQVTRTVDVVDTTVPVLTLLGSNPMTIEVGGSYTEPGATASDNYDGDLTGSIVINSSAVDTGVVGIYAVTYDVVDSSGNPASGFRTVNVVDTTAPVITLTGVNPQTLEVNSAYVELGATASDNHDGDITGSIVIDASAVNTSAVGSYAVTYNVADANGNSAVQVARTVDVVDTTAPVITLVGANPQTIEFGSSYVELGATALDDVDGDISGSIVINAAGVNTAALGSYTVTYDVSDAAGNPATQVTRTVNVVDTTAPVLTLLGSNPQTIEVGSGYVELGATASDTYDGDLTGSIVINAAAVNTSTVGSYVVTYDVADAAGNPASGIRMVNVVDTTGPTITLVGANPQTIEVGSSYAELGATASDAGDGDLTGSIVIDATAVSIGTVGSYSVTYNVTDSQGIAAVEMTRTVNVVDTTVPVITLLGSTPQVVEVGSSYVELGATAADNYDGDITGSIVVDAASLNTAVVGSYSVTYNVSDANGNAAVQVTRTVNVVDTTIPVITLVGANPQTIEVGSSYVELGATAADNYDGDITGSIVVDATGVNTSAVGSYSVTYNVSDSEGNAAVQVTRTVDVVDTAVPVITLVGANPQTIEVGSPYVELGATATDSVDGDISGAIVTDSSAVNTSLVGSYLVTYGVVDSSGNPAFAVRTVDVVDTTLPVITLVGANPQTIEVGSPYVELGATATDNVDGDVSGAIVVDVPGVVTTVVGSYSVTYDVSDAAGNAAVQVTRTVDVVDTTAPVITLVGANPQIVEVGSSYVELGATAVDVGDGNLSGSIVIDTAAVNAAVVGSYSVTYDVSDGAGNAAVQVTRTVDVVDTTLPVITLVGANPQVIEVGSSYVELGATAFDVGDGDISGSIVIDTAAVNAAVVGSYLVTYDVSDAAGNAAVQVTRTVDVVDTGVPVITLSGANPQTIEVGSPYVELGASAFDVGDGDISGWIVINAAAVDTGVVGSYLVTYDVVDSSGNPASAFRTVDVVDTTLPIITLVGANPQVIEVGAAYSELGATALDNYDGDLTVFVAIDASGVNTATTGSYTVTYNVSDANGNAAVQVARTVDVVDTTAPIITLVGANPQTIEVGSPYVELGATAVDVGDGDVSGSIAVDASGVVTAVVGSYPVTYNVSDAAGNAAVQVTRTVDVVDTTAPIITLVGSNPQIIEVGLAYTELGATATDSHEGDLTGSIAIDASGVDTSVAGSYSVTYDVSDSSGNAAVQVTRTVDVVDTVGPIITLLGANPQTIEAGSGYVELGATAFDTGDGDLTGAIVIDTIAVDSSTVGSYQVTYDVSDSGGNAATQAVRTVNVVDTTAPAITLPGPNPQVIEVGSPYAELGATASDNYDGDLTASIVINSSAVNTALVGSYSVSYNVSDAAGNPAAQVIRTVDVVDTTVPVITLLGADPQVVAVGSPYTEAGATALDNYDGDLTGAVAIDSSAVNTAVVGSYGVTYNVSDTNANAAIQVTRIVNVVNVAPSLGAIINQTLAEGGLATFTAVATDPDPTDTITYSLVGGPAGATIDPVTGAFSWTPSEAQGPNAFSFDVVATDAGVPALADSQTVTITVTEVNASPTIGAVPPQTGDELVSLTFGAPASDVDLPANNLTFSLSGAPAGASIDPVTGNVSWTPTEAQGPGTYAFDVVVVDDGTPSLGDTRAITVVVNEVNQAPMAVNPGGQSSAEADVVSLSIASSDTDVPANTLTYSAVGLPNGLAINPTTGEIAGTIAYTANGASPFTTVVTVTDDGSPSRSGRASFTWVVNDTNRVPVAADDTATIFEDTPRAVDVLANDSDPDSDSLSLAAVGAPAHGSASISGGAVLYIPDVNYFGPDSFSYTVSDGRGGTSVAVLSVNVTPVNDTPVVSVLSSLNVNELAAVGFAATAVDVEGDSVTFALAGAPTGAAISPSGVFSWTPSELQGPAAYSFDIVATDDGTPARSAAAGVTIAVAEVNAAPSVSNPGSQRAAESESVTLQIVATDSDVPGGSLDFSAAGLPQGLSIDPVTGRIAGILPFDAAGGSPYSVTVTVADNGAPRRSASTTFSWVVTNMNRAPQAVDVVITAEAGIPASVVLHGTDPDGDSLSYTIASQPSQATLSGGPRVFSYSPNAAAVGTDIFTFTVSDGNLTATGNVVVTIIPNHAPVARHDEYVVRRGGTLHVGAPGVLSNDRDPEGRPVQAVISAPPQHGAVSLQADGSFIYEHVGDGVDIDTFAYRISDGMRVSAPVEVRIIIEENVAPIVANDLVMLDEDQSVVFYPLGNDSDVNNEAITVAAVGDPANGTIRWNQAGSFTYTPARDWNGVDGLTYDVTDGDLTTAGQVSFVVRSVNDAPTASAATATGHSGETLVVDINPYATDVDGDPLTFLLEAPPTQTVEQIESGVFALDLDGVIRDLPPLAFVATDPSGRRATALLRVSVRIPAEMVGVPTLVSDDTALGATLGGGDGVNRSTGKTSLVAGLRLMVGSVLGTFRALRIPTFVLLLFFVMSLYMGLSRKFVFSSTTTVLPLGSKKRLDVVMAPSQAGVPIRTEPGTHQAVIHRFAADETGVISTGGRSMVRGEVWVQVETPEGDGWVNSEFVTEQQSRAAFIDDERAVELVSELIDQIYSTGDLLTVTGGHDLHVALYSPPVRFSANSLRRLLAGASVYVWWGPDGDAPKMQATFDEAIGEYVSAAYRNRGAHYLESNLPMPIEFANLHSLVVGNHELGEGWRIFFRYEGDQPSIAGIMREAEPNRAAMHGVFVREPI